MTKIKEEIRFDHRTVIVTGAGRGLGRAYASAFAERGANVLVNDTGGDLNGKGADPSAAESVVKEIRALGGRAEACRESVSTVRGGRRIVEAAMDAFGRADILVNNAGILKDRSFLKMTEAEWDDVIAVHLKGAFAVTQPALAQMKNAGYGRILFTSSVSGLFGNFGQTNYGAAKMGLAGLMNSLKIEARKYGDIKINAVAPTGATRMTDNLFSDQMKTLMNPLHNVPLVLFLCSEQNTDTGMIFCSKGGWYARVAVVCAQGVRFDSDVPVTPEAVRDRFQDITDLEDSRVLETGAETMRYLEKK